MKAEELAELESVRRALADAGERGLSIAELSKRLAQKIVRRTLARRLAVLVEAGEVARVGRARATRYVLHPAEEARGPSSVEATSGLADDHGIPLSSSGREIRATVQTEITRRKPTGYQRSFLDAYRPNETFYLSSTERTELRRLGAGELGRQPAGTYARMILERLLIDLSWNSSRLEGNTYSLLETAELLEAGQGAAGRSPLEAQMIINHKAAIEFLVESASEVAFNRYTLLNLHAILAENLLANPEAGGRLRTIPVGISHTVFHPLEGPQLISECFDRVLGAASAIEDPFEQAFFAMVHVPYLQPFEDGNKRVSRLAANIPFIRANLSPLSFVDVPRDLYVEAILGVYELNRVELLRDVFMWAYQRSSARYAAIQQSLGEPDPFRLRYRGEIQRIVGDVVRLNLPRPQAAHFVEEQARAAPEADRHHLAETIETELLALHEGNIARYRLRPSEFEAWRAGWKGGGR